MSDFAGERTYTQEEVDKLLSETQQITCKTCGVENVPDWKDGDCITCARYKILGSETQLTLQEQIAKVMVDYGVDFYEGNLMHRTEQRLALIEDFQNDIVALFTQALTSLKREMEKKKLEFEDVDWGDGIITQEVKGDDSWSNHMGKGFNLGISECQRVLEGYLK